MELNEIIKSGISNIGSLCTLIRKNKKLLDNLNSSIPSEIEGRSISEKIYYYHNSIKSPMLCSCGKHLKFIGFKSGYRKTCGERECFINERKLTCISKYGVDNPTKSIEVIKKSKETILSKWGSHYLYDPIVRSKFNKSMLEKWGVEWAQQSPEIRNKVKSYKRVKECLPKDPKEIAKKRSISYMETITNRIKSNLPDHITYISRENNENSTDSYINLNCGKCGGDFRITRQYLKSRSLSNEEICLVCNPKSNGTSKKELEVLNFISANYNGDILHGSKIDGVEIDIFIPNLNLAFEFNGLYWHSAQWKGRKFHQDKTIKMKKLGIYLIHIWEDDWDNKVDIVKSLILNKLGVIHNRIGARNCHVSFINDNVIVRDFLEKNHIQGFVGSKYKIGLYYNGELVSIMTFGNLRASLGQRSNEFSLELLRFCSKNGFSIIGGASKMFNFAKKNISFKEIISYADFSRSNGDIYEKLGFSFLGLSDPNYYYIIDEKRKHRYNFRKDVLVKSGFDSNLSESQIMSNRGVMRIWDCGSLKYVWNS